MDKRSSSASLSGSSYVHDHQSGGKEHDAEEPKSGAELYIKFEKQVWELDKELRKLSNKARELGSSAGILSASTNLRERLGRVLHLFRQNALNLYPEEIQTHMEMHPAPLRPVRRSRTTKLLDRSKHAQQSPNIEKLPQEVRLFSREIVTLFDCFSQFPQFVEELPDQGWTFAGELRILGDVLDDFENEFSTLTTQTYIYDFMADIGNRTEALATRFIPTFTKIGIPAIRVSQDSEVSKLEKQTIVAALFAGIATGMLQIYSEHPAGAIYTAIVMMWYISLIFSVASAMNGLLGIFWAQSIHRLPDQSVPWWILVWIKSFPLVFLVISDACSFAALVLIFLTPQQSRLALIVTTTLIGLVCFGLLVVSGWLIYAVFVSINDGDTHVWPLDAVRNLKRHMHVPAFFKRCWLRARASGKDVINYRPFTARVDIEQIGLTLPENRRQTPFRASSDVTFWLAVDKDNLERSERARHRWHEAVRQVIENQQRISGPLPRAPRPRFADLVFIAMNHHLVSKLRNMTVSLSHHVDERHSALVRSLQFSPNGKYLVTSSWDSQMFLFHVQNTPVCCERVLNYPPDTGYVHQVDWSPDGNKLLIRSNRKLIAWQLKTDEVDGNEIRQADMIIQHSPEETQTFRSVSWRGDSGAFFAVQGKQVLTVGINGEILRIDPTQHLELHDICVTKDSRWMICVGQYLLQQGQESTRTYAIIVWDLMRHEVAKRVSAFYAMNNVALASDDKSILVNYANKSPSQLWHLSTNTHSVDFTFRHSYMPTDQTPFAALPSLFGGKRDNLVLRSALVGHVFVWERDSAIMLHCIRMPSALQGRITSFAWNRGAEEYMFATGTRDGTIHIWTEDKLAQAAELEAHDDHTQQAPVYTEELTFEPERLSQTSSSIRSL